MEILIEIIIGELVSFFIKPIFLAMLLNRIISQMNILIRFIKIKLLATGSDVPFLKEINLSIGNYHYPDPNVKLSVMNE